MKSIVNAYRNLPIKIQAPVSLSITKKYINSQKNIRTVSPKLRTWVFERDNHTCQYCGIKANPNHYHWNKYRGVDYIKYELNGVLLSVDHKRPWSKGGKTTINNLITVCLDCQNSKRTAPLEEWQKSRQRVKMCQIVTPSLAIDYGA